MVLLLRSSEHGVDDPDPTVTSSRSVWVVQATPEELDKVLDRSLSNLDTEPFAIVAVGDAGTTGIGIAASFATRVDRLALIGVPAPHDVDRDATTNLLSVITAKTLLMNGQRDQTAANRDAGWYFERLASARTEMVPAARLVDGRLRLPHVWDRVLQHSGAPRGSGPRPSNAPGFIDEESS